MLFIKHKIKIISPIDGFITNKSYELFFNESHTKAAICIRPDSETVYPPLAESKLKYFPDHKTISFTAVRSLAEIDLVYYDLNNEEKKFSIEKEFTEIITNFQKISAINLADFNDPKAEIRIEFLINPKWDLVLKKSNRIVAHGDLIAEWIYEAPTKKERSQEKTIW
ncbi:hypothetical protein SSABA_v1c07170 [Spiroplasma sabaudiense Ar-1343]|uniref:Uncharacterized protein n=1 Tax=Spiroplasma sabaudiense Ar-1343 TaxID=1276257 RepID=W6AK66_9MOLU|nr:hypothetical protein [Spiroplasma sabaudiense]AHI54119.1 hypothetical protein SSABA_v1c07170 [Spiroplasma sabaudiense Ar-1343]